jgi:hypothetical protein
MVQVIFENARWRLEGFKDTKYEWRLKITPGGVEIHFDEEDLNDLKELLEEVKA